MAAALAMVLVTDSSVIKPVAVVITLLQENVMKNSDLSSGDGRGGGSGVGLGEGETNER